MSSYGHQDSDVPGAERDNPPASLPDMPLATGMYRREVRRPRECAANALTYHRDVNNFKTLKTLCASTTFRGFYILLLLKTLTKEEIKNQTSVLQQFFLFCELKCVLLASLYRRFQTWTLYEHYQEISRAFRHNITCKFSCRNLVYNIVSLYSPNLCCTTRDVIQDEYVNL